MTRSLFRLLCAILLLPVFGCSSVATKYPEIGKERKDVIAIAQFYDGYYLEQFEECNKRDSDGNLEYVCLDPPPMAIEAEIKSVIFGPRLPDKLTLATTGHFGLQDYDFENPGLFLIKLETDGTNYIMPRYEREGLAISAESKYFVPVFAADGIPWLPCFLRSLIVEIKLSEVPKDLRIPLKEFDEYSLKEYPNEFVVSDGIVTPRYVIYVDELERALRENQEKELSECEQ